MCLKIFHEIKKEGMLLNSMKPVITLMPKPEKDKTTTKRNCRPISLMNRKNFNKIIANQIQQHIKKVIYQDQICFVQDER
jgi:hypothetical protein